MKKLNLKNRKIGFRFKKREIERDGRFSKSRSNTAGPKAPYGQLRKCTCERNSMGKKRGKERKMSERKKEKDERERNEGILSSSLAAFFHVVLSSSESNKSYQK